MKHLLLYTLLCQTEALLFPFDRTKVAKPAQKVLDELNNSGVRAEIDTRAEKIGYKIREAQMKKIPYMLVVGAKEEEDGLVSVRSRFEGDEGQKTLADFLAAIKMEIQAKTAREVKKEDDK